MKTNVVWKESMKFEGEVGVHRVPMDTKSPIGQDTAATPKELVAMGLGGCTAMDVIALLKKYRQLPKTFSVGVDIESSTGVQPATFTKATLNYHVEGEVEASKLLEAVHLSQTKYCGVSAMLSLSFQIDYRVILNGVEIGTGVADFERD